MSAFEDILLISLCSHIVKYSWIDIKWPLPGFSFDTEPFLVKQFL